MDILMMKFIIAILIGALVGIEREHRSKGKTFAGFRTFMLTSLFGLLIGYLSEKFSYMFSLVGLLIIGGISIVSYWMKYNKNSRSGITTELAFLITYIIGVLLFYDTFPFVTTIFLAFILTSILYSKETLHEIAYKATTLEIRDLIIFVLIAFVVYPLLPNQYIDPWNAINPKIFWKGIVVILGLSYFTYIIFKIFKSKGLSLGSFFDGLINSMYVSYDYSQKFSKNSKIKYLLLIAVSSMMLRAFILGSVINKAIIKWLTPLLVTSAIGYIIGFWKGRNVKVEVKVKSPLSFKFAIFYAVFFTFIMFVAKIVSVNFGSVGVYVLSAIVGIVDVSSLTIALATMPIQPIIAARGIIILTTMNILGNWLMTLIFGNKKFSIETLKIELIPIILNLIILTSTFLF